MKILLLAFAKLKYVPYINFYLDNIDKSNDIHIVYWNRDEKPEALSKFSYATLHEYSSKQSDGGNAIKKAFKYLKFLQYRKMVCKLMKEHDFDFVIALHTFPAYLMAKELTTKFKERYIFDYRDSTYEKYSFFKKRIGKLVENSYATFVSSDGFRRFLPDLPKVYTSHNLLKESLEHRKENDNNVTSGHKIRIAYWGLIRDETLNRALINKVANSDDVELHYYGREDICAHNLKLYVKDLGANNVFFHGEYIPTDRYTFAENTDIIHNIYDNGNAILAMGNKYYDGIIFRIPQLCFDGSVMGDCITKAQVGLECSPYEDDFVEKVISYYKTLDYSVFNNCCDLELSRIMKEYNTGCEIISKIQIKEDK